MASSDRAVEWRGGSLDELVSMLAGPSLAARIEVLAPDGPSRADRVAGEVHMVAGGVSDAFAGPLRGDEAMTHLSGLAESRFRIETRAPDPESGGVVPPGPEEGSLGERSLASLMRYCEQYVMTCILEVWRGGEHATISYRRGEIISTNVDGSDAAERLPDVMTWTDGHYQIVLPPLVLPGPPRAVVRTPIAVPITPPVAAESPRTILGYAAPEAPALREKRPSAAAAPVEVHAPVAVAPAPVAAQVEAPRPEPTIPARAPATRPTAPAQRTQRRVAVRRRSLADLPVVIHVGLGLALGLAVVGAWQVVTGILNH
jgi:hypothetical protein